MKNRDNALISVKQRSYHNAKPQTIKQTNQTLRKLQETEAAYKGATCHSSDLGQDTVLPTNKCPILKGISSNLHICLSFKKFLSAYSPYCCGLYSHTHLSGKTHFIFLKVGRVIATINSTDPCKV